MKIHPLPVLAVLKFPANRRHVLHAPRRLFLQRLSRITAVAVAMLVTLAVSRNELRADAAAVAEVAAVHKQYDEAWIKQDVSALDRLLSDRYVTVEANAAVKTKADVLADARSGALKLAEAASEDINIQIFGQTAIVRGKWRGRGTYQGKPFDGVAMYITAYAKTDGTWKAVADQMTEVRHTEKLRAEIEAAEAAYVAAFNSGSPAAMARLYLDDAKIFPNEAEMVSGRPAIERFWKWLETTDLQQKARTLEVIDQGEYATETGTAALLRKDGTVVDQLKYIVIWKRSADGWKISLETWNKDKK